LFELGEVETVNITKYPSNEPPLRLQGGRGRFSVNIIKTQEDRKENTFSEEEY
jgi:hypothetical protein